MDYYHIAPSGLDKELSSSVSSEDEDDDDPNWFMTTTSSRPSRPRPSKSNKAASSPPTTTTYKANGNNEEVEEDDVISKKPSTAEPANLSISNGYYDHDPVAARICELFDEMETLRDLANEDEDEDVVEDLEMPPAVVMRRGRNSASNTANRAGFFQRRKQTVSGYFNDWTKWLRGAEEGGKGGGRGTNNGYIEITCAGLNLS